MIENKEIISDVAFYEPLCGVAIRTRYDVVFGFMKSRSEKPDQTQVVAYIKQPDLAS